MERTRIIAVASGKGGVGKTLTSVNMALTAAREGYSVALADADPLSDVLSLLDQLAPLTAKVPEATAFPEVLGDDQRMAITDHLHLLFPQLKKSDAEARDLVTGLLETKGEWLDEHYDLLILDLPAGADAAEQFPYVAKVDILVLVTNPEPTAHVAAGALLRALRDLRGDEITYLWQNKYESHFPEGFNPDDPVATYNANMPEEYRLIPRPRLETVAHVPPDPTLNLIKADPPVALDLHRSLADTLEAVAEAALPALPGSGSKTAVLIRYALRGAPLSHPEAVLDRIESILGNPLPAILADELRRWINAADRNPLRHQALIALEVVQSRLKDLEQEENPFSSGSTSGDPKSLDREVVKLLKALSRAPAASALGHTGSLLLFRFALLKLFSVPSAVKALTDFVPRRREGKTSVRDRRAQIARLLVKDAGYQAQFFRLVKTLYPVVSRQMSHLVSTFGLQNLLFRDAKGQVRRETYAKLLSAYLYETLGSGLGIVAGFRFRPASRAFKDGWVALKAKVSLAPPKGSH